MQTIAGRVVLSPSDLNDYIECPHLTTLALEVARGERARPFVADEHAELLRRKGELHERAYLERLRAERRQIVESLRAPCGAHARSDPAIEILRSLARYHSVVSLL